MLFVGQHILYYKGSSNNPSSSSDRREGEIVFFLPRHEVVDYLEASFYENPNLTRPSLSDRYVARLEDGSILTFPFSTQNVDDDGTIYLPGAKIRVYTLKLFSKLGD